MSITKIIRKSLCKVTMCRTARDDYDQIIVFVQRDILQESEHRPSKPLSALQVDLSFPSCPQEGLSIAVGRSNTKKKNKFVLVAIYEKKGKKLLKFHVRTASKCVPKSSNLVYN